MKALHEKYGLFSKPKPQLYVGWLCVGDVVRWAPNELSFSSAEAWKDIYTPRKPGEIFVKDPMFYIIDDEYVSYLSTVRNMLK